MLPLLFSVKYTSAGLEVSISIHKSMRYRIIVTAHKIVQTGFHIKIITAITERIEVTDMIWICNGVAVCIYNRNNITPCVISILCLKRAATLVNSNDISENIMRVISGINGCTAGKDVFYTVQHSARVIAVIETHLSSCFIYQPSVNIGKGIIRTIDVFLNTDAVAVVAIDSVIIYAF